MRVDVGGNGRGLRVSINDVTTNSCPDNIALRISVSTKDGTPVDGLTTANVSLSENGVSRGITGFSAVLSPTPVSVVLTLDFSGTTLTVQDNVKTASKGFIDQLQIPGDEAAVIIFSGLIELKQAFTDNQVALKAAIDSGTLRFSDTLLYDALWAAIDNAVTAKPANNRAIILISDGKDQKGNTDNTASVKTLPEVIAHARDNNVTIFTIGMGAVVTSVMT